VPSDAIPVTRLEALLEELIDAQERKLRRLGERIVPGITLDDLLAPDDVPALAADRDFMYEDGVLAGMMAVRTAVRAWAAAARSDPGDG